MRYGLHLTFQFLLTLSQKSWLSPLFLLGYCVFGWFNRTKCSITEGEMALFWPWLCRLLHGIKAIDVYNGPWCYDSPHRLNQIVFMTINGAPRATHSDPLCFNWRRKENGEEAGSWRHGTDDQGDMLRYWGLSWDWVPSIRPLRPQTGMWSWIVRPGSWFTCGPTKVLGGDIPYIELLKAWYIKGPVSRICRLMSDVKAK